EHPAVNRRVAGSSPASGAEESPRVANPGAFLCKSGWYPDEASAIIESLETFASNHAKHEVPRTKSRQASAWPASRTCVTCLRSYDEPR
ncbi:uncharacterized protein METZ01_LOCUS111385, partial [marine metagenome]